MTCCFVCSPQQPSMALRCATLEMRPVFVKLRSDGNLCGFCAHFVVSCSEAYAEQSVRHPVAGITRRFGAAGP